MTTSRGAQPGQTGQPGAVGQGTQGWEQATGRPPDHATLGPNFGSSAWPAFMAAGIGAVIVGIILLAWPKATLVIVAVLIGASLIVAGLLRLIDGFTAHDSSGGKRVAHVLIGLLAIIVGLYFIRHYHITIAALAILVGLFWVLHGIADIAGGLLGGPFPGRTLTVLAGVLSLIAGLIVLFWPTISITVLVAITGIWLIVYGIVMAVTGFSLRRIGADATHAELTSA